MTVEPVDSREQPWWVDRPHLDIAARSAEAAYEILAAIDFTWVSAYDGRCGIEHEGVCAWVDLAVEGFAVLAPMLARGAVFNLEALEHAVARPDRALFLHVSMFDWPFRLVEVDDLDVREVEDPEPGLSLVLTLCAPALAEIEASPEGPTRRARQPEQSERELVSTCRLGTADDLTAAGWVIMEDWPVAKALDLGQPALW